MVVANSLFDILLFGLLAVAVLLDFFLPDVFHGTATAIIVAAITYSAAQDLAFALVKRDLWSQESLATSIALCALGYLFYSQRNDADIILVVLSIGLMMASLMALIAIVACMGSAWHERSASPLAGFAVTTLGALLLGISAGLLVLFLTAPLALPIRLAVVVVGAIVWKLRGLMRKETNAATSSTRLEGNDAARETATAHGGWLLPKSGTVLDRLLPLLIIGALAFVVLGQSHRADLTSRAVAQTSVAQTSVAPISPAPAASSTP